jgi:hypothetical protein
MSELEEAEDEGEDEEEPWTWLESRLEEGMAI